MNYIASNLGPILAATATGLLIGALYAAAWGEGARALRRPVWLAATALAEFWLASILAGALILAPADAGGRWIMALGSAVVIWIGFVLPTLAVSYGFRRQGGAAGAADVLHWLVVMVAQAAVLQAIGLVKP